MSFPLPPKAYLARAKSALRVSSFFLYFVYVFFLPPQGRLCWVPAPCTFLTPLQGLEKSDKKQKVRNQRAPRPFFFICRCAIAPPLCLFFVRFSSVLHVPRTARLIFSSLGYALNPPPPFLWRRVHFVAAALLLRFRASSVSINIHLSQPRPLFLFFCGHRPAPCPSLFSVFLAAFPPSSSFDLSERPPLLQTNVLSLATVVDPDPPSYRRPFYAPLILPCFLDMSLFPQACPSFLLVCRFLELHSPEAQSSQ